MGLVLGLDPVRITQPGVGNSLTLGALALPHSVDATKTSLSQNYREEFVSLVERAPLHALSKPASRWHPRKTCREAAPRHSLAHSPESRRYKTWLFVGGRSLAVLDMASNMLSRKLGILRAVLPVLMVGSCLMLSLFGRP